jgi:membrane associated rhomboid family serine protease
MLFRPAPQDTSRPPIFNVPQVIVVLVAGLVTVHLARMALPDRFDLILFRELAYVPARIWAVLDPGVLARLTAIDTANADALERSQIARFLIGDGGLKPWTFLSYALLHGSMAHVGLNVLWLVAFGAPVARRFGPWRFLALLGIATVAGAVAQTIAHPREVQAIVGASAAVSGAMAAAVRFVFQPGENLGRRLDPEAEVLGRAPPLPLSRLLGSRQAVGFLAAWFVLNLLFGVLALPFGLSDQPIAWEAHIGGFLAGLLLFSALDPTLPVPEQTIAPQ